MSGKPKQIIAEQTKQAERDLVQRQARPVAIVKPEPLAFATDGWDDTAAEAEARVIRGPLLKFNDWKWSIARRRRRSRSRKAASLSPSPTPPPG